MSDNKPKKVRRYVDLREVALGDDVLIVGIEGAHAIAWKLSQSRSVGDIYGAPGNAAMGIVQTGISPTDIDGIVEFAESNPNIGLTIIAPDNPIGLRLVDRLAAKGFRALDLTECANDFVRAAACGKYGLGAVELNAPTVLPLLRTDLYDILNATVDGDTERLAIKWLDKKSFSAALVESQDECVIIGLNAVDNDVNVFFENVKQDGDNLVSCGERVLCVNAVADDLATAKQKVHDNMAKIKLGIRN